MKQIISSILFLFAAFLLMSFYRVPSTDGNASDVKKKLEVPADVNQVIQRSCYDCHYTKSKNLKGKKKLDFDKLAKLKTYKLVGKLQDIADAVTDEDMPPAKFLARHPEKVLSLQEKDLLTNWASEAAEKLTAIK